MMTIETVAINLGFKPDQALALEQACIKFGINTPLRASHFLAQVAHESGGGKWMSEIWGPTPAQKRYEGRKDLGNTQSGDGSRFRGRGLIQLTGRANYKAYSQSVYGDDRMVTSPEKVAQLPDAAIAAGWFWKRANLNPWADADDVLAVSRGINVGNPKSSVTPNGLEDRKKYLTKAKAEFAKLVAR